jgi:hypothetical protein
MAGICDPNQYLCLAFAFWNERDPILKERIFGLTGPQGNHGEDAKEYWWYADATPSHSYLRWRYAYPQAAYPYQELVDGTARRGRAARAGTARHRRVRRRSVLGRADRIREGGAPGPVHPGGAP